MREVVYRLEAVEDVTVSWLMAVFSALKLVMCLEPAGLPTRAEVSRRFIEDEDKSRLLQISSGHVRASSLPEKIRDLHVSIGTAQGAGQLLKSSRYEYRYLSADSSQPEVALLMQPSEKLTWHAASNISTFNAQPSGYKTRGMKFIFREKHRKRHRKTHR